MNATVKRLVLILPDSAFRFCLVVLIPQILFGMILFDDEPYWLGPTLVALCALAFGGSFTLGKSQLRTLLPISARDRQRASWWTSSGIPLAQLAALTAIPLLISRVGAGLIPPPQAWTAKMVRAFEIEATLVSTWGLIGWGIGGVGRNVGVRTRALLAMAVMTLLLVAFIRLGELQIEVWNTLFGISVTAVISSYFVDVPLQLLTKNHQIHQNKSVFYKNYHFSFSFFYTNIFKFRGLKISIYSCIISILFYSILSTLFFRIFGDLTNISKNNWALIGAMNASLQFNLILNIYFNMNQLNVIPVRKISIFISGILMLVFFSMIFSLCLILFDYGKESQFWNLFLYIAATSSICLPGRRVLTGRNALDLRSCLNWTAILCLTMLLTLPIARIFHHAIWAHPILIYVGVLAIGLACDGWLLNRRRHGYHSPLNTAQPARRP